MSATHFPPGRCRDCHRLSRCATQELLNKDARRDSRVCLTPSVSAATALAGGCDARVSRSELASVLRGTASVLFGTKCLNWTADTAPRFHSPRAVMVSPDSTVVRGLSTHGSAFPAARPPEARRTVQDKPVGRGRMPRTVECTSAARSGRRAKADQFVDAASTVRVLADEAGRGCGRRVRQSAVARRDCCFGRDLLFATW